MSIRSVAARPTAWWLALLFVFATLMAGCSDSPSPAPRISVQPTDTAALTGTAATLSVAASGPDISYQWQQSSDGGTTWTNLAGATQASYTTASLSVADDGRRFRVVVTAAGISLNSSAVTLTVTAAVVAPAITVTPPAVHVTAPANAVFSVTATGTALTYQWQRSTDGGTTWLDVGGATAASFDAGPANTSMSGQQYRVTVANGAGSVTSAASTLTVDAGPGAPAFSAQLAPQSVTAGSAAAFSVVVTGTPTPTLQWQRSTDAGSTWADIAGATDPTYNTGLTTLGQNGERYRVVASNSAGTATSDAATLSVAAAPQAPAILTQPADQTATAPATASFSATASGVPTPTWQWQRSSDGGATWANVNGAIAASYVTPATQVADSGTRYRALATNASGTATTAAALLTVNPAPVAIAYEGFDYPIGDRLQGKNGGSGWSGAWSVTDGSGTPLDISLNGIVASGLRYTDAAGNDLVTTGGAWQTDAGVFFGQALRASTATTGAAGSTRWLSFLVKQAAVTGGVNYGSATLGTGYSFGSPAMVAGIGNSPQEVGVNCFYCSSAGSSQVLPGFGAGSVAMVLVRIDFNADTAANDTVSVWVNPPLDPAQPLGTPMASASVANYADAISGLTLLWGDNRSFTFDELRISATRDAAAPFTPAPTGSGTQVFFTDFESGIPAEINAGTAATTGVQNFATLGPTGNKFSGSMLRSETGNTVTITLNNLPPHSWLTLDFLFAAIDSLDGSGAYPSGDFYRVTLDGVDIFRESFANATVSQVQTYVPPPNVQLARMVDLGFGGPGSFYTDSAYWLGGDPIFRRIPHSGSTAVITMRIEGAGIQDISDESWGIDNLRVTVGP